MQSEESMKKLKTYRPVEDPIKAREYLHQFCLKEYPCMSIPPDIDDWDMVFSRIIDRCASAEAIEEENKRLREALTEAKSLLELSDYNGDRAKNIKDEPLDSLIKKICETSGYGAVMDSAARQWFLKDKPGSITTGASSGSIRVVMHKIEQALKGKDK